VHQLDTVIHQEIAARRPIAADPAFILDSKEDFENDHDRFVRPQPHLCISRGD
jgi:hypothetical protein